MTVEWAFPIHFACVAFMTGLIWLIQMVHYPLMNRVSPEQFVEFHHAHSARITGIVAPVMGLELLSAAILVFLGQTVSKSPRLEELCLGLSLGVFAATAFLSVPLHHRLARGFDSRAHQWLVRTNWVRTILWSVHLGVCLWMVFQIRGSL
ncbi:MAG: hypothetical protein KGQ59_08680 [Bdellovibrionales bacterium]|nr:hypothetical protein [Bdellovibrionales bacterium]